MIISLLVAADEKNVIGKDNKLPWHLPNDLRYFKNKTWGMPILMGRKTFESIGKALPGRKTIVITRNKDWQHDGIDIVHSLQAAISKAADYGANEIFIIGGAEIFQTSFQQADRIYFTRIHHSFDGDVFFPAINETDWKMVWNKEGVKDEKNNYSHTFQIWEKK